MATRTLGFRLEFKGSAETEAALEKVRKKMTDIKDVIKKFESTPLTLKTSFDTKEIAEAEKQLVALKEQQKELVKENKIFTQSNRQLADNIPKDSIIGLRHEISKLNKELNGLSQAEREGARGQELIKNIKEKDATVRKFNEELNRFQHNVGNYKSAFGVIGGSLQGFGDKFLRVSSLITGGLIGAGLLGLLNGVKAFGQASITEFTQAETALAKIKQQLIATGNASGKTAEGLRETAKSLQTITGIDDDQILNDITSSLLRFGSIGGEVFDRAQKAAIDLSATLGSEGGGLKAAATIVGKALEDPEKAVGRLAKAGVVLDKQQEKAIQTAIKQNDTGKAQILVLEALEGKFKGVSDAIQDSSLKNARSLSLFFQNLKESAGEGFIVAFNTIAREFQRFNENATAGTKETQAAIAQLNAELGKEKESIHSTFEALKDKNLEDGVRKKLIDDLIKKYPQYLDKLQLEKASNEDLEKIEKQLTETVKKATFERILARTKESLSAAQDAERIRIASLKSGSNDELSFFDKFRLKTGEFLKKSAEDQKTAAANLRAQEASEAEERLRLKKEQNDKLEAELKKSLEQEFGLVDESNVIITKELGKGVKDSTNEISKELQAQEARIEEIRRQNADRAADLIANEFDKKIQQAKLKAQNSLADLQAEANKLSANGISATDQEQLDQIKIQSDLIREGLSKEIGTIEQERLKAITTFKQSLVDSRNELLTLINESNVKLSEGKISTELFNQDKRLSILKQSYDKDILNIEIALRDKNITQEDFDKQSLILTATYSANVEKEVLRSNAVLKNLYQQQFKDKKAALEQAAKINIAQAEKDALTESGNIDPSFSGEQKALALITIEEKKQAKIKQIKADADAEILKSSQDLQKKQIDLGDKELAAFKANAEAKKAITLEQKEKIEGIIRALSGLRIDIKVGISEPDPDIIDEIKKKAIDLAGELNSSISEIERNNSEQGFERRKSDIESEYDNRIKLAKGNTAEIERIEREKAQRIKAIEREQSQRRKEIALREAAINTALAILKAATGAPFPFNLPAILFATITGALQLAVIKSQKFAKGGYAPKGAGGYTGGSRALPDETGYRPVPNAVLHEGEHVSTERQVSKNRMLYEIIERDRIRTNNGQPSILNEEIIRFAEAKKQALYGQKPSQGIKYTPVIPVIIPLTGSKQAVIEISKDNMKEFASLVAKEVAQQTGSAVFEGSSKGITNASKESIRLERAALKSQV